MGHPKCPRWFMNQHVFVLLIQCHHTKNYFLLWVAIPAISSLMFLKNPENAGSILPVVFTTFDLAFCSASAVASLDFRFLSSSFLCFACNALWADSEFDLLTEALSLADFLWVLLNIEKCCLLSLSVFLTGSLYAFPFDGFTLHVFPQSSSSSESLLSRLNSTSLLSNVYFDRAHLLLGPKLSTSITYDCDKSWTVCSRNGIFPLTCLCFFDIKHILSLSNCGENRFTWQYISWSLTDKRRKDKLTSSSEFILKRVLLWRTRTTYIENTIHLCYFSWNLKTLKSVI